MSDPRRVSGMFVYHEPVDLDCSTGGPSMTRQEFAAECDINNILRQYENTGVISHVNPREPMYVDLSEFPDDMMSALVVLDNAKAAFMSLPALVRKEFDNDPLRFIEFASDPQNLGQMRDWGLAPPAPKEPEGVLTAPPGDAAA